jgi:hypothetical protein
MKRFIILIVNRNDHYDRYWVTRSTREEAEKVALEYEKDHKYITEIVETV